MDLTSFPGNICKVLRTAAINPLRASEITSCTPESLRFFAIRKVDYVIVGNSIMNGDSYNANGIGGLDSPSSFALSNFQTS